MPTTRKLPRCLGVALGAGASDLAGSADKRRIVALSWQPAKRKKAMNK